MTSKRCFKCACEKPIDCFYAHSAMRDGRLNKCIDCTKRDALERRQENLEHVRAYDRLRGAAPHRVAARKEYAQTPEGKVAHQRALRASRLRFPERAYARQVVGNAVRDGRLKPQPCWVCGEKAEAHHPDYSTPLDVVWLCLPHHKQAHQVAA